MVVVSRFAFALAQPLTAVVLVLLHLSTVGAWMPQSTVALALPFVLTVRAADMVKLVEMKLKETRPKLERRDCRTLDSE